MFILDLAMWFYIGMIAYMIYVVVTDPDDDWWFGYPGLDGGITKEYQNPLYKK